MPPLNALRAFEAAARHGRMNAAADELGVTPGAVSRQVALLEETLGITLFAGTKAKPELTDAAKALLPGLSAAFDQIAQTVQQARQAAAETLDVSCLGTFALRWLIPRLHRFQEAEPTITVRLTPTSVPVDITREGFDLAIMLDNEGRGDLMQVELFGEEIGLVTAPALAAGLKIDSILPRLSTRTRPDAWNEWARLEGVLLPDSGEREFQHYYFTLEAAVAGLGVAIAPRHLVAEDIRAGRLAAPFGFRASGGRYVARHRRRPSPAVQRFCEWLRQEAAG
ncbi:LysR substrate-binding domain-containing protein [Lacibacterium aquatile]|uniref:LysR substrate-binding domain-containing protein n=1 Tax=Lacibacterium aquatile TaxID=1168082 RepID=A0ABW5DRS9_9PROT